MRAYVDHPADRSGATKYGITRAKLASWGGADVYNVRALARDEAAKIYRKVYYLGPDIDTLPEGIQEHVFDIAVNLGLRTAVKLL